MTGPDNYRREAVISDDGLYRYKLTRRWGDTAETDPHLVWVMLNPSTADGTYDDPTIRKCVGFARRFAYGGIHVVNLFAYRATDPRDLAKAADPVGPHNVAWQLDAIQGGNPVVAAWGAGFGRLPWAPSLVDLRGYRQQVWCLGTTRSGMPRHPLYVPYTQMLEPWDIVTDT